jgi:hypothetical protein
MDLILAMKESGLSIADEAAETIVHGWVVSPAWHGGGNCADTERVYRTRYERLVSHPGEHPKLLASGISEVLSNLKAHGDEPAYSHTVSRNPSDNSYLVINLTDTNKVVGCVRILKNYEPI